MSEIAQGGNLLGQTGQAEALAGKNRLCTAKGLYRHLVVRYVEGSLAAVSVSLFLVFIGLDLTAKQAWYLAFSSPFGTAVFMVADIYLIGRHFTPLRRALVALDRGERPEPAVISAALARALNLPLYTILRVTFVHGPLAALIILTMLTVGNYIVDAGFAAWQKLIFASLVLFFAAPTHAIFEYFSISRDIIAPIGYLSRHSQYGLLPEHQPELVSVRLRSKLIYLSIFVAALPTVFLACSTIFKVDLILAGLGITLQTSDMLPLWLWIGGVALVCAVGALVMSALTAAEVSRSAATLSAAMRRVEAGNLDADLRITTTDEYADLFRGFNMMIRGLRDEVRMLEVTHGLAGELNLDLLIRRIMTAACDLLDAERATLFVYDRKTKELFSRYGTGVNAGEIRIPANSGIAGAVFTSGKPENILDAYQDPRFDKGVDQRLGYHTRGILCMPISDKQGTRIGVTQVLNKRNGAAFSSRDEARLMAFTAQISVSLENAQLFDEVLSVKTYNESILKSTSNGMVTLDTENKVVTANEAALRILRVSPESFIDSQAEDFFHGDNGWVMASVARVTASEAVFDDRGAVGERENSVDARLKLADGDVSVNMSVQSLFSVDGERLGSMLVFEDITAEQRVKATMARYMSKEVADQLLAEGESVLGGKAQTLSILFSDVRGFTTLAEALGARETVSLLNEYFSEMVDVVFQNQGILDKYIGDAIMALFGAPFVKPGDADHAVEAANQMLSRLRDLNQRRQTDGKRPFDIGVGIATGEVVLGNIGSPARMEYTVIGDSVNLASRLEGANKYYKTKILIDEATVRAMDHQAIMREIDLIRVVGKDRPVAVFEAVGYHNSETCPHLADLIGYFSQGLTAYRARDWQGAMGKFEAALAAHPTDQLSKIYIERCRHLLQNAPGGDWDGVWVLTEK